MDFDSAQKSALYSLKNGGLILNTPNEAAECASVLLVRVQCARAEKRGKLLKESLKQSQVQRRTGGANVVGRQVSGEDDEISRIKKQNKNTAPTPGTGGSSPVLQESALEEQQRHPLSHHQRDYPSRSATRESSVHSELDTSSASRKTPTLSSR